VSESPSEVHDCSDLLVRIKNNLHLLATAQNKQRLEAFRANVCAKDGINCSSWQYLPIPRLESLDRQLANEVAAIEPVKKVVIHSSQAEAAKAVAVSNDDFF